MASLMEQPIAQARPIEQRNLRAGGLSIRKSTFDRTASIATAVIVLYIYSNVDAALLAYGPHLSRAYFFYGVFVLAGVYLIAARQSVNMLLQYRSIVILELLFLLMISVQFAVSTVVDYADLYGSYVAKAQFVLMSVSTLVIFGHERSIQNLQRCFLMVTIFNSALNALQFFFPFTLPWQFVGAEDRAAGLYLNANSSALFIAIAVPIITLNRSLIERLVLYFVSGVGVLVTFSRGGWALWAAAVAMSELTSWRRIRMTWRDLMGIGSALIGLLVLIVAAPTLVSSIFNVLVPYLDANTGDRLRYFMNDTAIERLNLAHEGWEAFLRSPIFGNGLAYTQQWEFGFSVHNMWILMLAEQGLIGFSWLIAFYLAIARRAYPFGLWIAILASIASFATHNLLDGCEFAIALSAYFIIGELNSKPQLGKRRSIGRLPRFDNPEMVPLFGVRGRQSPRRQP